MLNKARKQWSKLRGKKRHQFLKKLLDDQGLDSSWLTKTAVKRLGLFKKAGQMLSSTPPAKKAKLQEDPAGETLNSAAVR